MSKFNKGEKVYAIFTVLDPCAWIDDVDGPVVELEALNTDDSATLYERTLFPLTPAMKKEITKSRKKELQDQIKNLQKELDSLD